MSRLLLLRAWKIFKFSLCCKPRCKKKTYKNGRDKDNPKFTDHYFSGDYPVELIDQKTGIKPSQLSLLIEPK